MLRDFTAPITDLQGKVVKGDDGQLFTYKSVIGAALFAINVQNPPSAQEKYERFKLSVKIESATATGGQVDLTTEDMTRIKDCVGFAYGPLVVGRVYDWLEDKPQLAAVKAS